MRPKVRSIGKVMLLVRLEPGTSTQFVSLNEFDCTCKRHPTCSLGQDNVRFALSELQKILVDTVDTVPMTAIFPSDARELLQASPGFNEGKLVTTKEPS